MTLFPHPELPRILIQERLAECSSNAQARAVMQPMFLRRRLRALVRHTLRPDRSSAAEAHMETPNPVRVSAAPREEAVPIDTAVLRGRFLARTEETLRRVARREAQEPDTDRIAAGPEVGDVASLTFHQFVDLSLAYGHVPVEVCLAPLEDVQAFLFEGPDAPLTPADLERWRARRDLRRVLEAASR